MTTVTLYSKPACGQCDMTKRVFIQKGIKFTEVDISQDAEALDFVKELGFMQVPVIIANTDGNETSWSGFRPDKINAVLADTPASAVMVNA